MRWILALLLLPSYLEAMKISRKIDPTKITSPEFLKMALETAKKNNPDYKVFNESDIRNLSFLAPHLKKHLPKTASLRQYENELSTLYFVVLRHPDNLSTAENNARYLLIDLKRFHITHPKEYPQSIKEKCAMLIHYFERPSLKFTNFLSKLPTRFHESFRNRLQTLLTKKQHLTLSSLITLDKSQETGYFVLLRFRYKEYPGMKNKVFELKTMRKFLWDSKCSTIRKYYEKHEEFFKRELLFIQQ